MSHCLHLEKKILLLVILSASLIYFKKLKNPKIIKSKKFRRKKIMQELPGTSKKFQQKLPGVLESS